MESCVVFCVSVTVALVIYSVLISDVKVRGDRKEPAIDSLIHRPKLSCLTI